MNSDVAIKVENLSKLYQIGTKKRGSFRESFSGLFNKNGKDKEASEFWALKDVSFEIKKGEAVGIIGRNGAGKSTLLKILSRITEPTHGRIEIDGRVSSLLEVGTGFHPELTGRENIFLNGTILGMRRREVKAKFDEIVDFSGVGKFIDTPVKHYSSGMYVRLAFAVAAHLEPEILIIDEVLAVGDAEFQKKCLGKMEDVSKNEGRTVIFVSHNMGAVGALCSKGITLNNGRVFFLGNISDAITHYFEKDKKIDKKKVGERIDLGNHPNKKYLINFGLQSVLIRINGKETNILTSGDTLEFEFQYKLKEYMSNPVLGIVIRNPQQEPIIGINNMHTDQKLSNENFEGVICFKIDNFNVYGNGEYPVDLYFGDNGDNFDIINDAFSLELITKDSYKTGYLPNPVLNKIYLPHISIYNKISQMAK